MKKTERRTGRALPFLINIYIILLANPGTLTKPKKFQLTNTSFRNLKISIIFIFKS